MKTFKSFLKESKHFNIDKFEEDCSFLFQQLVGTQGEKLLYRGLEHHAGVDWEIKDFKLRTKPRDSSVYLHNKANEFFVDFFNEPIRNWLFTTGYANDAKDYGKVFAIFPIGEFKWVCNADIGPNAIRDLYGSASYIAGQIFANDKENRYSFDQRKDMAADLLVKKLPHARWNVNERLEECIDSKNEIHVKCEQYYQIDIRSDLFYEIIKPRLKQILS
jgi:hypothetical protein